MSGNAPRVFHYTVANLLQAIVESGEIRPATAHVRRKVRPCVWCSCEPEWEETANKGIRRPDGRVEFGTRRTTAQYGGGLARIEVAPEAAPHTWADYKRVSGESAHGIRGLSLAAHDVHADPSMWRVSFTPIPAAAWLAVEMFGKVEWGPWPKWHEAKGAA